VTVALKKVFIRVTSPDNVANGMWVQKEVTFAIKKLIKVTSLDNVANGIRVQSEVTFALKKS
jgi:hypothetical protein